jgi:hypothetical protein
MRAHRLSIVGKSTYALTPEDPDELVNKAYVDSIAASSGGKPPIFITDVTAQSTGIVGLKQYQANTVPANVIVNEATSDTQNIRVHFLAEGPDNAYSPVVTGRIGSGSEVTAQSLTQVAGTQRLFQGYVNLTITGDSTITITSSTTSTDSVYVVYAADGPEATSFVIGSLPGSQTEVKNNDVVPVSGTVPNSAVSLTVQNFGAAKSGNINSIGANDSAGAGFKTFSGTMTVGTNTGTLAARIIATNALGTSGDPVTSSNTVTLNQTFPTIGTISITYPGAQTAIKSGDSATVSSTITNADIVAYSSSSNISVVNPSTYAASKTVNYVSGSYVYATNNYTITATKNSNGAVSTANAAVNIANVAPTAAVAIVGSPARLRSSLAGETYEVRVTANQVLASAPTLDVPANGGTWSGSWTFVSTYWRRYLVVVDSDTRTTHSYQNVVLPSISGATLNGSTLTSGGSYTIGGFLERIVTFAAFERYHAIGTTIGDITKTRARYVGTDNDLTRRTDTNNVTNAFTIVNSGGTYDANGTHLFLNDLDFANSNTSGTLQVAVEETA